MGSEGGRTPVDDAANIALELLTSEPREGMSRTLDERLEYSAKFRALVAAIFKIAQSKQLVSSSDIHEFYHSTLLPKHVAKKLAKDEVAKILNDFLRNVEDWACYLTLSGILSLPKGYELGHCTVHAFNDLPKALQEEISDWWKRRFELNRGRLYGESFENFQQREAQETYLGCKVAAVGYDKAIQKTLRMGNQALSIYKCIYGVELPQLREVWLSSKKLAGGTPDEWIRRSSFPHHPLEDLEQFIQLLTRAARAETKCDIERNLILATEVYGIIEREMPNELKFLLAMMSLEAVLSGGAGPVGWKLRERVALLLGDDPSWVHIYLRKRPTEEVSQKEVDDNRVAARVALSERIDYWYALRSGFAHGGTRLEDRLTEEDIEQSSMVARFSVQRILQLYNQLGIRTVAKRDGKADSLDSLLESVRLSQPLPLKS